MKFKLYFDSLCILYIHMQIYIYIYIYKFTSKCQSQSTSSSAWRKPGLGILFSTLSAKKQTRNYDTECSDYHPSLSTLKVRGIELQQDEIVSYIYTFTSKCHSQTNHPWSKDNQSQKKFLAPSSHKQTRNYDTEC